MVAVFDLPADQPVFTAADLLAWRRKLGLLPGDLSPQSAVLCFGRSLLAKVLRKKRFQRLRGLSGDVFLLKEGGGQLVVAGNFGVGAPAAVVLLEDLAALGVRRFIALGLAGGLQSDLQVGSLVICERAVRDEGTSRHYGASEDCVPASPEIVALLKTTFDRKRLLYRTGSTWTTDAPYRELAGVVRQHRQAGVLTVEMEAAGLFAAGKFLGVQVGAAFVIGDTLSARGWRLDFDETRTQKSLETAAGLVIRVLLGSEP
jgi:uridine phosphorylase